MCRMVKPPPYPRRGVVGLNIDRCINGKNLSVHEYGVGRSLANRYIPLRCIPISTLVRGKVLCSSYPGICLGGSLHV